MYVLSYNLQQESMYIYDGWVLEVYCQFAKYFYVVSFTTYAVFDTYLDIHKYQYRFVVVRTIL